MSSHPLPQLPPPSDDPRVLAQQALGLAAQQPDAALAMLQGAAHLALQQGEPRVAALVLHRRAALALANEHSPVPDLAMAARLLAEQPAERALVLLDLGHALLREGDVRRATLTLRESEMLARTTAQYELSAAARHALSQVAEQRGDYASARDFLREAGTALAYDVERELLATLRDMGNLSQDSWAEAERTRRQRAVEEELAALKREVGG